MPTYQYRCSHCGHELDIIQRFTDKPLVTCPECKLNTLKRVISGGNGFILTGKDFYSTNK